MLKTRQRCRHDRPLRQRNSLQGQPGSLRGSRGARAPCPPLAPAACRASRRQHHELRRSTSRRQPPGASRPMCRRGPDPSAPSSGRWLRRPRRSAGRRSWHQRASAGRAAALPGRRRAPRARGGARRSTGAPSTRQRPQPWSRRRPAASWETAQARALHAAWRMSAAMRRGPWTLSALTEQQTQPMEALQVEPTASTTVGTAIAQSSAPPCPLRRCRWCWRRSGPGDRRSRAATPFLRKLSAQR
mmetsp:Transcript_50547/g.161774  ORF Transcript_50547/g.161774 Transcript_50547/m.161774 type:complete len:244 (+) Transcript_50547:408-1139(+)